METSPVTVMETSPVTVMETSPVTVMETSPVTVMGIARTVPTKQRAIGTMRMLRGNRTRAS
jgi:hypothetical protein